MFMSKVLRRIKSKLGEDQVENDRVTKVRASSEATEQEESILSSPRPLEDINFATPENSSFYSKRKYKYLDPDSNEIRLLKVHPRRLRPRDLAKAFSKWTRDLRTDAYSTFSNQVSEEDFICASLIEDVGGITDGFPVKYAALSYCAGSAGITKRIMIDGYWFNAFANLEHSLERFRKLYDARSRS